MRELKFRIWCKGTSTNANFNKPRWILPTDFILLKYYRCFQDVIKSDDFVVQQYTGKNDELDNEVYEGDIVYLNHYDVPEVDMSCLFEIIFESGAFQLKPFKLGTAPNGGVSSFHWLRYIEGEDARGNTIYSYELPGPEPICRFGRMRVIGNIFENSELLKQ